VIACGLFLLGVIFLTGLIGGAGAAGGDIAGPVSDRLRTLGRGTPLVLAVSAWLAGSLIRAAIQFPDPAAPIKSLMRVIAPYVANALLGFRESIGHCSVLSSATWRPTRMPRAMNAGTTGRR